ncbi:hypothetical protein KXR53_02115 [Inquilinus limosus]|uniref:hypothetical protein n=1 Tax=Inquilinus limosus TaxID=171674 RepID=UPI003F1442EF
MTTRLHLTVDISSSSVFEFLTGEEKEYHSSARINKKSVKIDAIYCSEQISLCYGRKEYYCSIENDSTARPFNIIIPIEQPLLLTIVHSLLVRSDTTQAQRDRLLAVFRGYDPAAHPDPERYIRQRVDGELPKDLFRVAVSFSLLRTGAKKEHIDEREAMLNRYRQGHPSSGETVAYMKLDATELVQDVPMPTRDGAVDQASAMDRKLRLPVGV